LEYGVTFLRFVWLCGYTLWVGGFLFYAAFVQPIHHDLINDGLDPLESTGTLTRLAARRMNLIGAATVSWWWLTAAIEFRNRRLQIVQIALLFVTTAALAALFRVHPYLSMLVDSGQVWRPWHRAYLWISTVQFFANVALLFVTLQRWRYS
jgi:hypothetical protein